MAKLIPDPPDSFGTPLEDPRYISQPIKKAHAGELELLMHDMPGWIIPDTFETPRKMATSNKSPEQESLRDDELLQTGRQALERDDYELANSALAAIRPDSPQGAEAAPTLAGIRFQLARSTADHALEGEPLSSEFRDIIQLLELAETKIANEKEAEAIRSHQLNITRQYINRTYQTAVADKRWEDATLMLGTLDRVSDSNEERVHARTELSTIYANMAVERLNEIHSQRESFFNNLGKPATGEPLYSQCRVCGRGPSYELPNAMLPSTSPRSSAHPRAGFPDFRHDAHDPQFDTQHAARQKDLGVLASTSWYPTACRLKGYADNCNGCALHLAIVCHEYEQAKGYAATALALNPDNATVKALQDYFTDGPEVDGQHWLKLLRSAAMSKPNELEPPPLAR